MASSGQVETISSTRIYANDDLILVNPQQSTAIFIAVIVASTAFEFVLQRLHSNRNVFARIIIDSVKKEVTVLSVCIMCLQFIVNSFPSVSVNWRVVVGWVALCEVYITIFYCIGVALIVLQCKLGIQAWREFEWARINADAHHSITEQLFKLCHELFITDIARELHAQNQEMTTISPVAFSVVSSTLQIDLARRLACFSFKSWASLALIIFVNGARTLSVSSLDKDRGINAHIITFVALGAVVALLCGLFFLVLRRRLRAFVLAQSTPETYAGPSACAVSQCLLFGSERATLDVLSCILLMALWFSGVFIVGFVYLSGASVGGFATFVYMAALVPPAAVILLTPRILDIVSFASALSPVNRSHAMAQLEKGAIVSDTVSSSDDESGSNYGEHSMDHRADGRRGPSEDSEEHLNTSHWDGEYDGPSITLSGADGGLLGGNEDDVDGAEVGSEMEQDAREGENSRALSKRREEMRMRGGREVNGFLLDADIVFREEEAIRKKNSSKRRQWY